MHSERPTLSSHPSPSQERAPARRRLGFDRRTRPAALALGMLALSAAACGDEHSDSAKAKCETLVDSFCETVTSCAEEADLLASDYPARALLADCKKTVGAGAHCGDAKEVTSRYESCLSAANERLDCDDSNASLLQDQTFAIPAQCQGVIRY